MDRRNLGLVITIVGTLVLANAWWFMRGPEQTSARERAPDQANERERDDVRTHTASDPSARAPELAPQPTQASREQTAKFDRAKADALRSAILQAQQRARPPVVAQPPDEEARPPGQLTDRIGGREALLEHLNHDFMPLADECIEQARVRLPELEGLLAIGLDTVADAELGGIVEAVAVQPDNEVDDPELLECISQTAMSMILPPPPESGREQFVITMPIEAEPK